MRKVLIIISGIIVLCFTAIIVLTLKKNVTELVNVYSIPKSYCYKYKDDRKMSFEIYVNDDNSMISIPEENTYKLVAGSSYFNLNNVNVEIEYNTIYDNEEYYKYTITADILNFKTVNIKDLYLEITNKSYTILVKLGSLKINTNDYQELIFTELYGNYSVLNEYINRFEEIISRKDGINKFYNNFKEEI